MLAARAFAATRAVVAATSPADYGLPTPCDEWDVRTLVNHIIGGSHWYAQTMRDRTTPPIEGDDDDYCAGDPLAAYDAGIAEAVAAFGAPGAETATIHFLGRDRPATSVEKLCALDTFVHGWDLAVALGLSTDLDPAVAEALLDRTRGSIPDALRGTTPDALYRPATAVPPDATAADRVAAFLGRAVG